MSVYIDGRRQPTETEMRAHRAYFEGWGENNPERLPKEDWKPRWGPGSTDPDNSPHRKLADLAHECRRLNPAGGCTEGYGPTDAAASDELAAQHTYRRLLVAAWLAAPVNDRMILDEVFRTSSAYEDAKRGEDA